MMASHMHRIEHLALGAVLTLGLVTSCVLVGPGTEPPPARGVVLVLAAGFGGGVETKRTPALARLSAGGRAFEAAFAPDPGGTAARAALLGGSLASLLRSRGVATAGLGDGSALPIDASALELHLAGSLADEANASRLEAWLRGRRERFALFAAVGGQPVAGPGPVPATLAGAFAPPLPRIAVGDLGFSDRPGGEARPAAWSEPARQRAQAAQLERSLSADRELAQLVALVERAAPGAATVVVGDPPPDRGLHGRLERGDALFDDTLRSALVVATPGLGRPGRPSSRLVSTLDVAPTLLALVGLPPEPGLEGQSLMPLLVNRSADGRGEVVSSVARKTSRLGRSLRSPRFRYTEWPDGSRELYDHDADPGEHTNLAGLPEHAATIAKLERALAASAGGAPAARPRGPARPRNVLLIVVDDLNTRLGAWGAPVQTPAIDRLAARGVRFDRAYAQVAMCSPSRVSLLTGWRPERTGVWQNEDPPRPAGTVPLQELFAAHGAWTASVGKVYHLPADFLWDLREDHPEVEEEGELGGSADGTGLWVAAPGSDRDQPDGRRARRAATLVERHRGLRPFFLALGLVRPHARWVAPTRYFGLYPPDAMAPLPFPADDLADVPAIAVKTQAQPLPGLPLLGREPPGLVRDPAFRRQAIAAYQACVSFADAQVGVVLEALDRGDRWKDTVVVLLGDNGFHLGEHAGLLRKDTLFEEALRVPLVVAAPGLPRPGSVVRTPVELLDVYPTIVELAGLVPASDLDGQSLVPLLENPDAAGRGYARSWRRVQPTERAVSLRTARLRYTLWPDGSEELYDRRGRAPESLNLAARAEWAVEKAELRARLEALLTRSHNTP
jgi:arylsulfatase A-like enzyme